MPNREIAIAGYGDTYADEDDVKSPIELAVEATVEALGDSTIHHDEIDALLTGRRPMANPLPQWNNILAGYMNITTTYSTEVTVHGAGILSMFRHALGAINNGFAETVLCVHADAAPLWGDPFQDIQDIDSDPEFEYPYGPTMPALYGMVARRYLKEFDATKEDMARVAVEARKWGTRHPKATMSGKGGITVEDVLESRPVAEPLNLFDCAPWGPGGTGAAFIVTEADRAERLHDQPIYVRGVGEYSTHDRLTDRLSLRNQPPNEDRPNLTTSGAKEAARQAYAMADMTPDDMDIVESANNFSHIGLIMLEDLGFCEKGEAPAFVENGGIDFEDGLPYNTNGGWLSFGQSGAGNPRDLMVEAIRQLRGEALGVQVTDPQPETALVHGLGGPGPACNSVAIVDTKREET